GPARQLQSTGSVQEWSRNGLVQTQKAWNFQAFRSAEERTRTSTPVRELAPEASASANSATSAYISWVRPILGLDVAYRQGPFAHFVPKCVGFCGPPSPEGGRRPHPLASGE